MTNVNNEEGEDPDDQEEDDGQTAFMFTGTSIADESEIIHNSAQFLYLIAQQKVYCMRHNLPNWGTEILSELEQLVIGPKLYTVNKQTKLSHFLKGFSIRLHWQ